MTYGFMHLLILFLRLLVRHGLILLIQTQRGMIMHSGKGCAKTRFLILFTLKHSLVQALAGKKKRMNQLREEIEKHLAMGMENLPETNLAERRGEKKSVANFLMER